MLASIDIPVIVNCLFLHDVQISMSGPSNINVFYWNKERFFFRHIELYSWFSVMAMDEVKSPWIDQKSAQSSASSVVSVG